MSFIKIPKEIESRLNLLTNASNRPNAKNELTREAFSFYFAYLDFINMEKHVCTILKDLATQEDKEMAVNESRKLMYTLFRHFSNDAFLEYTKTMEALGQPVPELPDFQELSKLLKVN